MHARNTVKRFSHKLPRGVVKYVVLLGLFGLFVGCTAQESGSIDELDVSCSGKCDGISSTIRSIFRDGSDVPVTDLIIEEGLDLATDELNDQLAFGDVIELDADFESPEIYRQSELNELVSGLLNTYGERELTTVVNQVRADHLAQTDDELYAETAFRIRAGVGYDWDMPIRGFAGEDGSGFLGFDVSRDVETRVIAPFEGSLEGPTKAMLEALMTTREFVLPRSIEDIIDMEPGELFAMSGSGRMGLNVGASVPIVLAEPVSVLTYRLVLSAALSTVLEGDMDIQLIRMEGNEVILDIGLQEARTRSARIQLRDSWGVAGICEEWPSVLGDNCEMELAGQSIDLGRLVERALQKQLNRHLGILSARAERSQRRSRISMARLRFDLQSGDQGIEQALAQAMRGDVRLAQALAGRNYPGVVAEFDLARSGVSNTSYAGVDFVGMRFFSSTETQEGTATVQTPAGAMSLMFDSLHEEAGRFNTTHGHTRVALAGLVFDAQRLGTAESHANFLVQLTESDTHEENDGVLDHIDAIILSIAGEETLHALEVHANDVERHVRSECGNEQSPISCYVAVQSDQVLVDHRNAALSDFASSINGRFSPDVEAALTRLAEQRVMIQATGQSAGLSKPGMSMVVDYRLDNGGLDYLMMQETGRNFSNRVQDFLQAVDIDRHGRLADITKDREDIATDDGDVYADFEAIWTAAADQYEARLAMETTEITGFGQLGPNALEITFPVDSDNVDVYEDAVAQSLARGRALVVAQLFDDLLEAAEDPMPDLYNMAEHTVVYGLLSLLPPERTELRMTFRIEDEDDMPDQYEAAGWESVDLFIQGEQVNMLDGAMFDMDVNSLIYND